MTVKKLNACHETSSSLGDGAIELLGAVGGNRNRFSSKMANGEQTWIYVGDDDQYEILLATLVTGSPDSFSVDEVVERDDGSTDKIDWGTGVRDVYSVVPAQTIVTSGSESRIDPEVGIRMTGSLYIELEGDSKVFRAFVNSSGNFALLDKTDDSLVLGDEDISGTRTLKTDRPFEAASVKAATITLGSDDITTAATRALAAGETGTAQAGGASTITLASTASSVTGAYVGARIRTTGGTGSGQKRAGIAYNPTTKVLTVDRGWATQPDSTTTYAFESAPADSGRLPALDSLGYIPYGMVRTMVGATDVADGEGGMVPWFLSEERHYTIFGDGVKRPVIRRGSTQTIAAGAWALGQSLGPYSHGLTDVNEASARPSGFELRLICATGELGYSSGWDYPLGEGALAYGTTNAGIKPINISSTQYRVLIGTGDITILNASDRTGDNITVGNWNIEIIPWRWSWL